MKRIKGSVGKLERRAHVPLLKSKGVKMRGQGQTRKMRGVEERVELGESVPERPGPPLVDHGPVHSILVRRVPVR